MGLLIMTETGEVVKDEGMENCRGNFVSFLLAFQIIVC